MEYDKGVPVNTWKELYRNELVHSGNYIHEPHTSKKIKEITESLRVDLNLWSEVDYHTLNIELISPKSINNQKEKKS